MVERNTLYILDYYSNKNTYLGSDGPINFRIHKIAIDEVKDDEGNVVSSTPRLEAIAWKGPLIYDLTKEEKKKENFEFSEEGMTELINWLEERRLECLE